MYDKTMQEESWKADIAVAEAKKRLLDVVAWTLLWTPLAGFIMWLVKG